MVCVFNESVQRLEKLHYFRRCLLVYLAERGRRSLRLDDTYNNYQEYCTIIMEKEGAPADAPKEKVHTICFFTLIIRGSTDYLRCFATKINTQLPLHEYLLQALEDAVLRLSFPQGTRTSSPSFSVMVKYFLFFYLKARQSKASLSQICPLAEDLTPLLSLEIRKDLAFYLNMQTRELCLFLSILMSYVTRRCMEEECIEDDYDEIECFERNVAYASLDCDFTEFLTLPFVRIMIIALN